VTTSAWLGAGCLAIAACASTSGGDAALPSTESGGATTVHDGSRDAFSYSARNLDPAGRDRFLAGRGLFRRAWVTAPASTEGGDGLGPTYTATSCSSCHVRSGRGALPTAGRPHALGLVTRLVRSDGTPDPSYGRALQPFAIEGVPAEGRLDVAFEETRIVLADGTKVALQRPTFRASGLAFGPLDTHTTLDVRVAPHLVGLGLLEAIPDETLTNRADPNDRDGDGIRGEVGSASTGARIGRFGWRAQAVTIRSFVADAFHEDIGMTSDVYPQERCPPTQRACADAPHGGEPELSTDKLDKVAYFLETVAVPARRDVDSPEVRRGEEAFATMGCAACHVPRAATGRASEPALSEQIIFPYTDLLLHDLGPGLGETKTRTPPLWGLGLHAVVNGNVTLLHDGRARTIPEAILWHGGEATRARDAFSRADAPTRHDLQRFLESL
jgi:CxxC motif-containing protein (DUF1111 family)